MLRAAHGQVPSLTVQNISNSKQTFTTYQNVFGEYDRDIKRTVGIAIELIPFTKPKDGFEVQWFFVAKTLDTKIRWVYDAGWKHAGSQGVKFEIYSHPLAAKESRYMDFAIEYTRNGSYVLGVPTDTAAGSRMAGWIVRVKTGGKIVRMEASPDELKDLAEKYPGKLDDLLRGVEAEE